MFINIGEEAKGQVVFRHHLMLKSVVKAQPTLLWCYKKDLGFSSHRKDRMESIQKKAKSVKLNFNEDDPFELLILLKFSTCSSCSTSKFGSSNPSPLTKLLKN
ncbi:hypothetical protein QAD02_011678 [Eretmocerus hayati]|uniref:Uncharacterized protein n=1 Tax=Eretmocerus hayati TaxID=131215 RepID=A0ACC2NXP6_9HYME|nr:hypothetical protein QAD02_011678 [Eretmocerus hayati]